MDNPMETEQSIKTLWHAAEIAKGKDRKVCFFGQDVYNIFSNYSYQIEVEMMGNAQIQPLMYFQLLNIPMWRGAYMIFNVSHTMTPGNMVTKFKGMKMSKNPVPILSKYWSFVKDKDPDDDSSDDNGDIFDENDFNYGEVAEQHKITTADAKTKEWLWGGNDYPREILKSETGKTPSNFARKLVTVNIPLRKKSNGTPTTGSIVVHNLLKEKVENIFREISELPSSTALIYSAGGQYWRRINNLDHPNSTTPSNHAFGNAIDVNVAENGFITYDNKSDDNLHLRSYNHPVVKIFAKYGFLWGGRYGGGPTNSKKRHDYMHFEYLKSADGGSVSSSINPPSGGKSIFETNINYSKNAICQDKGKFNYTLDNMKECVLYFVAMGEGGNRNPSGNHSTDYCGINRSQTSFYTTERKRVLDKTRQNGFVAAYDNAVFNFYYSTYMPYKKFFESCKNPFTRYMGLLALKAGPGYYGEGWKRVGGQDMEKLSELNYTSKLAREWINLIENGYTGPDGKVYKGYGTDNEVYWASVKKAKKYNKISD